MGDRARVHSIFVTVERLGISPDSQRTGRALLYGAVSAVLGHQKLYGSAARAERPSWESVMRGDIDGARRVDTDSDADGGRSADVALDVAKWASRGADASRATLRRHEVELDAALDLCWRTHDRGWRAVTRATLTALLGAAMRSKQVDGPAEPQHVTWTASHDPPP